MKIRSLLKAKDILTITSATAGFTSIIFSIHQNFMLAAWMLIVAALFDYFDGKVARKVGPTKYGHYLDLGDLSSFGVAPAVFIILWLKPDVSFMGMLVYAAAFALFIAGLLRLARFFTLEKPYSIGLPITFNGLIFPVLYWAHASKLDVIVVTFITTFLMLSTLKFKKR